jgi:hypothetical protein
MININNKPFQLTANIDTSRPLEEIMQILLEVVRSREGKIQSCSQNNLCAKFGSWLMQRLFGAILLSSWFENKMPFRVNISVKSYAGRNHISVYLTDNAGFYLIRDSWFESRYEEHFIKFLNEVKEKIGK